jgi:nitrous oxidase accessory protein NosD
MDSHNAWDNGLEGNYWSNYNGGDSNGDGIGDTPYIIDQDNQDNYPLIGKQFG